MDLFFELHSTLDREGPGDDISTARAFYLCRDLPPNPRILDIGCGPGAQTLALARLAPTARIYAFDLHMPFLRDLIRRSAALPDAPRAPVVPLRASMFDLPFAPASFDLVWSEGAIYIRGFEDGLRAIWDLLTPGGYAAVSELSWTQPDPPAAARDYWAENYPAMRTRAENQAAVERLGYRPVASFVLPKHAWIDNYYLPIQRRGERMRAQALATQRPDTPELLALLAASQHEFDIYRQFSDWYGYVFTILQKP